MAKSEFSCDCNIIHHEAVTRVTAAMPCADTLSRVSYFFRVLGDDTRTRIIWALDKEELCVCDLANVLDMTKSAVSHQLGTLRRANLVRCRREGKTVYYALADDHVRGMLESAIEHVHE